VKHVKLLPPTNGVMVRYVLPSAIKCFFHVYEERLGRYGLSALRHVLAFPGQYARPVMKTSCNWIVDQYDYVTVTNDIVIDHTWCRTCVEAVAAESKRRHSPERDGMDRRPIEEILAPVIRPLTKEVL
jgi:hypothetical protein